MEIRALIFSVSLENAKGFVLRTQPSRTSKTGGDTAALSVNAGATNER
jgi:hypothetical protein